VHIVKIFAGFMSVTKEIKGTLPHETYVQGAFEMHIIIREILRHCAKLLMGIMWYCYQRSLDLARWGSLYGTHTFLSQWKC